MISHSIKTSAIVIFCVVLSLTVLIHEKSQAQEAISDKDTPAVQSNLSTTHVGRSPIAPNEPSDSFFVSDTGGHLDTYLFRYDVPSHRLTFDIGIDRYYSSLITSASVDSYTGLLLDNTAKTLVEKKLLPKNATLILEIYDVDHENTTCPEVDLVFVNGHPILDYFGNPVKLTSGNNQWSQLSISIPINRLKFPIAPGANGGYPVSATNKIEIEIDAGDCGKGNNNWAIEVDWGAIQIASPIRPFVLVHGWTGNGNGFSETDEGLYRLLRTDYIPVAEPITYYEGIESTAITARLLEREIAETTTEFGVDKVNLIGHSKGGLFARWALRFSEITRKRVEHLITLASPNHGINITEELGAKAKCEASYWGNTESVNKCKSAVNDMIDDPVMINVNYSSQCKRNWPFAPWEWVSCEPSYFEYLHRTSPTPNAPLEPKFLSFVGDILGLGDLAVTKTSATYPWMANEIPLPSTHNVSRVFYLTDHATIKQNRAIYQCVLSHLDQSPYPRSSCPLLSGEKTTASSANNVDPSVLHIEELELTSGQQHTSTISVSDVLVTFNAISIKPISLHLRDPFGRIIDEAEAMTSQNITYTAASGSGIWRYQYEVTEADSGSWQVVVSTSEENYVGILVQALSTVLFTVGPEHNSYQPGSLVRVYAVLTDSQNVVPLSAVTGSIRYSSTVQNISFLDDGQNGDAVASDGIYTAQFEAPQFRGQVNIETLGYLPGQPGQIGLVLGQRIGRTSFTVVSKTATIQAGITEVASDLNGNGLFDNLTLNIPVMTQVAGDFYISGRLVDSNNVTIAETGYSSRDNGQGQLSPGIHMLPLVFDGKLISQKGANGPFMVTNILLRDQTDGDYEVELAPNTYQTSAYTANQFEAVAISLVDGGDFGVDADNDGKFDWLDVQIGFDVRFPGYYSWNGRLVDEDEVEIGWYVGSGWLDSLTPVYLSFDASRIATNAEDGPYFLRDLSIYMVSGSGVSTSIERVHTTQAYKYLDFDGALPKIEFRSRTVDVIKGSGRHRIDVILNAPLTSPASTTLHTTDVTAIGGEDYLPISATLPIAAGQLTITVPFDILNDGIRNGTESFRLEIGAPQGLLSGRNNPVTINILDFGPAAAINVLRAPVSLVADGMSTGDATMLVSDEYGNPVPGEIVYFSTNLGTITRSSLTDAAGVVTATVTSGTTVGTATILATVGTFVHSSQVNFVAGPPTTVTLTAAPTSLMADGASTATLTAVVKDAHGNPAPNQTVAFATTLGAITNATVTNADGVATATLTSAQQVGVAQVTASLGALSASTEVTFAGSMFAGVVFVDRNQNGIRDADEPGIPNVTAEMTLVSLAASSEQAATAAVGTTWRALSDADGNYRFTDLPLGDYTLTLYFPRGYAATTPTAYTVTVGTGQNAAPEVGALVKVYLPSVRR